MVATFKLDDVLALGKGPRQPDGGHCRFGPGTDKADFLDGGKGCDDLLRQLGFAWCACAEAGPIAIRSLDGLDHGWMRVAKDQRSPGTDIIDVLVAVSVPDVRALAAYDVRWLTTH